MERPDLEREGVHAGRRTPGGYGRPLLELACLLVVLFALGWGFRGALDLNVWDEAHYMRQGRLLLEGRWRAADYAWSLPLAAVHAALERLGATARVRADLVPAACALAAAISLWWALRRILDPPAAFLAACWWAGACAAVGQGHVEAGSYALGLALTSLGLGLVAGGREYAALLVMVIAALNRGEIALWIALTGALWIVFGPRSAGMRTRSRGWAYAGVGLLVFALFQHGYRARFRAWLAFGQHFEWARPEGATAAEVFPGARSVIDAARIDPAAFAAHVGRNARALPGALRDLFFGAWEWTPRLHALLLTVLLGFAAVGIAARAFGGARRSPRIAPGVVLFLLGALAVIPVTLVLRPRHVLLVPLVPAALTLVFGFASAGWRVSAARLGALRALAPWMPVAVAVAVLATGGPYRDRGAVRPPHRVAVELLRERAEPGETLLAAQADVLLLYAGFDEASGVNPLGIDFQWEHGTLELGELGEIDERFQPGLLLDTPLLRRDPARARQLDALLASGGWRLSERRGKVALHARVR